MKKCNLVAVGRGSAAATVASRCRAIAWSLAIVESRRFGGTSAMRRGLTADQLKEMRYSYPSHSDDISYMV
jgi:hypothetical protein